MLKWLTNITDPEEKRPSADAENAYLAQLPFPYVLGDPHVPDVENALSLEELKARKIVGVYRVMSDET